MARDSAGARRGARVLRDGPAPRRALVRALPDSFQRATSKRPPDPPIDLALARRQHRAYVAALAAAGLSIIELPADEAYPDSVFVEDTAVVAGGRALITSPGLASRRGEVGAVAAALSAYLELAHTPSAARLEGGDVLRAGRTLFVGRSGRSDGGGARALGATFGALGFRVRQVPVPEALHLKCVCSSPAEGVVLLAEGTLDPAIFTGEGLRVLPVPAAEAHAANVVRAGDRVLVAAGYPETRAALEGAGFSVVAVENSELRKADGSLSCCSILF